MPENKKIWYLLATGSSLEKPEAMEIVLSDWSDDFLFSDDWKSFNEYCNYHLNEVEKEYQQKGCKTFLIKSEDLSYWALLINELSKKVNKK